jgi:transposase
MSRRVIKKSGRKTEGRERQRRDIPLEELKAIIAKVRLSAALGDEDVAKLDAAVDTLSELTLELEAKGASVQRLRRLLFGASTEKSRNVVGEKASDPASTSAAPAVIEDTSASGEEAPCSDNTISGASDTQEPLTQRKGEKSKRPGHGRNGAASYTGATKVKIPHERLKVGDLCKLCLRGKLYLYSPSMLVRVTGMAPLQATVYELERLRCNTCGEVFTAQTPEGVGKEKYDESASAMVGMLKYGTGVPFYRLERLEGALGIPMPASTQWDLIERALRILIPAFDELMWLAAQGDLLHNDDTPVQILELFRELKKAETRESDEGNPGKERTGKYTTGIVSVKGDRKIALFLSGKKHAGENLRDLLDKRAADLPPPIHMSDALSANNAQGHETIRGSCTTHARRNFVEVATAFPEEVRYVLEELRIVYANDDVAKRDRMSDEVRLAYHQERSGPVMKRLKEWLDQQIDDRIVEPNSTLGKAIKYMRKHWDKLTLFLCVPGAPLDNNICERILKKAILHRKNALFYATLNGAHAGDVFMSLIHTAELAGENPFDYLLAMLKNPDDVLESPEDWLPWNYRHTLDELASLADDVSPAK